MKFYTTTLAATSALCLSMGMAYADSNTLHVDQTGNNNIADVDQSHGSGNNRVGSSANPVTQIGDDNYFKYNNVGQSLGDATVDTALQQGNNNKLLLRDWGSAGHNATDNAQQIGNDNYVYVEHNYGDRNTTAMIEERGNDNHIRINQNGNDGIIGTVSIVGSGNGGASHSGWRENWGILIAQGGGHNSISNASIEGDNNDGWPGSRGTAMSINQTGTYNTASASMVGSDGNRVLISQGGIGNNNAVVIQGDTLASTNNSADVLQNGDGNATRVEQLGSYNTVYADFLGDSNGVGTMTGVAGALADNDPNDNLFQGNVFQDSSAASGLGNLVSYDVTGSDNLYAFAQIGGSNSVTGSVTGNSNQVAVLQTGTGNVTGFTQTGGNNNAIAVSQ
jgi:hypothetical protein